MSWSDRRIFLLTGLAALAGCGFAPAYAPGGAGSALRGAVALADPKDRDGFDFFARLEDRLGRATAPRFRLDWSVQADPVGAGITPTGAITRYTLKGQARFALTAEGGATVSSGTVESFTSWSTSGSTVATLTAEQDARRRLMVILADQVVARLIAAAPK